jgi:DNA polymerase-3 subunit delta'
MLRAAMLDTNLASLIAQPSVSTFLRGVIAGGRFGNAYLFDGPAGVGKCTAALAFARAMMCEHGVPRVAAEPSLFDTAPVAVPAAAAPADDLCGVCAACTKTATLQHPDLKFLFPVSGPEKELDESIVETIQALREDPLHIFQYEQAASVRLSMTREVLQELGYKPYESARRVVVVRDADRMREDQYSALLKAIEEPGASTVWVLTTSRVHRLPATIRSRCQRVRFSAIPERVIADFLQERAECGEPQARMLAALASGSLGRALAMREHDAIVLRNEALALLEPALKGDAAGLWRTAQGFAGYGKAARESLRRMGEFHQLWLRDLLRARYGEPRERLVNRDREPEIRRQAERLDATEIRRRLMVLEEMLRAIEGNVSANLALFSGLSRLAGSRMGEGEWPRHAAARWDY